MKELVFNTGGRKYFNEDFDTLQILSKGFMEQWVGSQPFILRGLELTLVSGTVYNISAGYVWLDNTLRWVSAITNQNLAQDIYINAIDSTTSGLYEDGATRVKSVNKSTQVSSSFVSSSKSLKISTNASLVRRYKDHLATTHVLRNPNEATQTISQSLSIGGSITVSGLTRSDRIIADQYLNVNGSIVGGTYNGAGMVVQKDVFIIGATNLRQTNIANGNLSVSGNGSFSGVLTAGTSLTSSEKLKVYGKVSIGDSVTDDNLLLSVKGRSLFYDDADFRGTITVDGSLNAKAGLYVDGISYLRNLVTVGTSVTATTKLQSLGHVIIGDTSNVQTAEMYRCYGKGVFGKSGTHLSNTMLQVYGNLNVSNNINLTKNLNIGASGGLIVNSSVRSFIQNLDVSGFRLATSGTIYDGISTSITGASSKLATDQSVKSYVDNHVKKDITSWTNLALTSNFDDDSSDRLQYKVDMAGNVHVAGRIRWVGANDNALSFRELFATLPVAARPDKWCSTYIYGTANPSNPAIFMTAFFDVNGECTFRAHSSTNGTTFNKSQMYGIFYAVFST